MFKQEQYLCLLPGNLSSNRIYGQEPSKNPILVSKIKQLQNTHIVIINIGY